MREVDVVVVGAGFSGLYALHRLRQSGLDVQVFEAADGIGGTWRWNRYPGCRCDVTSMEYSYSFSPELEQEWTWRERYGAQDEILAYLEHVADRFDLRRDIQLETRVTAATFDEDANRWLVETDQGDRVSARWCVTAAGCLSQRNLPSLPGQERFGGRIVHTGAWPVDGLDVRGLRVGVVGTGSSGVQAIPLLAEQADELLVFQRTPHFVVPARNHALTEDFVRQTKARYRAFRDEGLATFFGFRIDINPQSALDATPAERQAEYERRWQIGGPALMGAYEDLIVNREANETAAAFVRSKIAEIVDDPEVARLLMPTDYPIGTKRLCQGTDYYETYNRDNVTLVDVRSDPIVELTADGLRTESTEYPLDVLVLATGYDAVTGALLAIDVRGRDGLTLRDAWADGPRTYLGVASAGFPNLFFVTGPGSPSVLSNMVVSIEQHVDWIADLIAAADAAGAARVEADAEAQRDWMAHVGELADATLFPLADSWYLGANVPGKPRAFLAYAGGVTPYREHCDAVAAKGYEGFALA